MVWNDILGHEKTKNFLKKLIVAKQRPHAFLLCGSSGIGKRLVAETFAKTILCGTGEEPCGKCVSCKSFAGENHPDYFLIQPELKVDGHTRKDSITIEQVRDLLKEAAFLPKLGDSRVAVIDGAHMLVPEAANSLLKFLEEPPQGWLFVLVSSNQEAILPTLLSRVTTIRLAGLQKEDVLKYFAQKHSTDIQLEIAANIAGGSIGQTLYFTDAQADGGRRQALDFLTAAVYGEHLQVSTFVKKIPKEKALIFCEFIATFLRDIWRIKILDVADIWNNDLLIILEKMAQDLSVASLRKILQHVEQTFDSIKRAANPQLAMEGLYILICEEK